MGGITRIAFLRGGIHPAFFVKHDCEIAVDQQTRARDRIFEGVPDSGCTHGARWTATWPNFAKTMLYV